MPSGRISKFDKSYCKKLEGFGVDGEGVAEALILLKISRDTFYRWQEEHETFSDAVKQFKRNSQAWWEKEGRKATFGEKPGFNATSFIFNMKNRFKEDWSDMTKTELSGPDGGAIPIEEISAVDKLTALLDAKSSG